MSLVSRLGLTRNEGLYLVFVSTTIYEASKDLDGLIKQLTDPKQLTDAGVRDSWANRDVGYNVQDILQNVVLDCVRDGSEVEARPEYLDRVRRQIRTERESFRDVVGD